MDLAAYLQERAAWVEGALERCLGPGSGPATLVEAMRYSLLAGGKRLRPVLAIAAAELVGHDGRRLVPSACALEMVHTYSLVHDDLPCMDDDDYRRGRLTCHKVYGEATAVLAGDALLTLAFQVLAEEAALAGTPPERIVRAVATLARAAGPAGMAGGQVEDLFWEGKAAPPGVLQGIHARKTGALITASLQVGGLLAGAGEADLRALRAYGENLGLAFQIRDDVLDVIGDRAKLGKSTGKDEVQDKTTYVKLYGLEQAGRLAMAAVERATRALATYGTRAATLEALAYYAAERDR